MRAAFEACLKILLVLVAALILVEFLPSLAVPLAAALVLMLVVGGLVLMVGGIAGSAVLLGLVLAGVALAAALSPLLVPVALILGIVWLVKRLGSTGSRPTPAA